VANPNIPQGTLNRLLGSVLFPNFPSLNITASFLGAEGIDVTFEGEMTANIPSLTGTVTSPEPYQMVRMTIHLLKSQPFADLWKRQLEQRTVLGPCTCRLDSNQLSPYSINNTSAKGVDRLDSSGKQAAYVVSLSGTYNINAALWP
jgi:hypothetical protein